jgi:hypothetical protein
MGTIPNAMIVGISSAYRETGLLYRKWKENFGKNDDEVLVIMAPTLTFHPTYDKRIIDRALASDPERAAAEYLVQWRKDLADYVSREVAEAAVVNGRILLEPMLSTHYTAFADPSGGSRDSMTLAIAHRDKERGVLDCLLERRAPFNPADVVAEFAGTLKQYKIRSVTGDRYAGEWPKDRFSEHGIAYEASELTKSEIYRDFLPLLNAGKVDMLDNPRLLNQLCSLERRAVRGGRDSIDHPQQGHDDLINAAAGALLLVMDDASQPIRVSDEALARARMPPQMRRPY